jgi:hypothetical protein
VCIVEKHLMAQNMIDARIAVMDKVGGRGAGRIVGPAAAEQNTDMDESERCVGL